MTKYLAKAKYTVPQGVSGLFQDGGSTRVKAVTELVESLGGSVECFYFAFGDVDAYTIVDMPDAASAAAVSLAAGAAGGASVEMVHLLTAQEIDEAAGKSPVYDAPGP